MKADIDDAKWTTADSVLVLQRARARERRWMPRVGDADDTEEAIEARLAGYGAHSDARMRRDELRDVRADTFRRRRRARAGRIAIVRDGDVVEHGSEGAADSGAWSAGERRGGASSGSRRRSGLSGGMGSCL